nr:unnamed protein product [Callosobruchus chinensis]
MEGPSSSHSTKYLLAELVKALRSTRTAPEQVDLPIFCPDLNQQLIVRVVINTKEEKLETEKINIMKGIFQESEESDSSNDESAENPSNGKILKVLNSRIAELEKAITFNGDMMDTLQKTIKAITEENKPLKKEQDQLKTRVTDLEKEVNVMKKKMLKEEKESRKKDIIIMGLKKDKDAEINVKKIFTKMEQDADNYKLSVLPTSSSQKAVIVVQFQKQEQRNAILEKGNKLMLDGQNCNISNSTSRIYINEDLPREVRAVFKYARELKKEGFKYVWCKNGQVYVRKEEGGAVVRVHSHADVNVLKASREYVVKLGVLNVRSLLSSFGAVVNVVVYEKFDIFAVTETWLIQDITADVVSINNKL